MKIWFITRSYPPQKGGGPLMRELQVEFLKKKYDVEVVTINHNSNEFYQDRHITYIPYTTNKYMKKVNILFEMFGILNDSHKKWIDNSIAYLKNKVQDKDLVLSTTGGELASMLIGNEMKKINPKVKHIINYHDLLDYGYYENERVYNRFHVNIDKFENECLRNADYILANSDIMKDFLINKFEFIKNKIDKLYFGFKNVKNYIVDTVVSDKITIANVGSASFLQSPDILIKAYNLLDENYKQQIKLLFIGDKTFNATIKDNINIETIDYMQRNELIPYIQNYINYTFVSLINIISFKPAMPTKFYEYIGLELPIIGALPENSEASQVIAKYGFGYNCIHGDIECLKKILMDIVDNKNKYKEFKDNLDKYGSLFDSEKTLQIMYKVIELLYKEQNFRNL